MKTKRFVAFVLAFAVVFAAALPLQAQPGSAGGCFNVSGFYMRADDSDYYSDFAGFSLKLGIYITDTTELFGECMFGDGLDMPEYIDYSYNIGLLLGLTQYLPLSDQASLYFRAKAGVTVNIWEFSWPYDMYTDDGYCYSRENDEETDTFLTGALGAGLSIRLSETVSLEVGYDYIAIDSGDQFEDEYFDADDYAGYHTIHAGLDIEF
ncbi:MAG: outer membrane protein [Kiritimatiellia bacterium]|jgi:hypothetical protein